MTEFLREINWSPLWISLKTGLAATVIAFFLGIFCARKIMKLKPGARAVLDGILTLPLVLPPTVAGFFLLLIFSLKRPFGSFLLDNFDIKIVQTWKGCVVAAAVIAFPLMYRNARAAFEQVDINLIHAGQTLGMSDSRIFWRVVMPAAGPGIASGTVLAFARAIGEYGATSMLAGNILGKTRTVSVAIASETAAGNYGTAGFWVVVIVLISFVKRYENKKVDLMAVKVNIEKNFRDFSLKVDFEGSSAAIGLLGASGSGKSMTLRCIAGIETPDKGRIVINGKTVFDSEKGINLKPQKRRIGYLFQNYALFPTMTVEQNIRCGYRGEKSSAREKVADLIRRYHLEGLEKRLPSQLSGGQQQRVALARMMIGEPEAILLDEPFSALDSYLKDVLQREMQDFLKDYPGDMILVTHSRDEAYKFCRELSIVHEGRILVTGEIKQLFERPGLLEAAKLTGCKNFSRAERLGPHEIYAADWKMKLHTEENVDEDITYVGIRGHWIRPESEPGENCMAVQVDQYIETTFEHQYMIRNKAEENAAGLWWMRPKNSFTEDPDKDLPEYLYLPPEHLMLLK